MKQKLVLLGTVCGFAILGGCTSGTTYGTGVSHEEQTIKSMYNMLSIKPPEQPNIEYDARPDLVMPANKQVLPTPGATDIASTDGQQWPVEPEQRIAAVRAAAPTPDERSGELPVEYLTSEKEGIQNSSGLFQQSRANTRDGGQFIEEIRQEANNGGAISEEVRRRRGQLSYSTGVQRKFLTEPPAEYRRPSVTAEAGDTGFDNAEIAERIAEEKRLERQNDQGMWTDN